MPALVHHLFVCPQCGGDEFEAVTDGEATNFLCHSCWTCWYVELGYVRRVSTDTCPGCQHRAECLARRAVRA